eukprot:CAMPEP_0119066074 /NCGR_PEP_ID=MMETSP1178-20130426/8732_1 /TAXON_ID=33656 /ORGANISM="unid sp, Strain CCMP2000" /LENGTH=256 /DNA_ID=CAMNT_0007047649 /DNA_START=31 /DNA_END=801 /DNA_ORIENTATION=+
MTIVAVVLLLLRGGLAQQPSAASPKHPHKAAVEPCTESHARHCCGDGVCNGAEDINTCMADCPGVTTSETCGEEPHSDRGGKTLTFGVGHRTSSAQECCNRCTAHAKAGKGTPCNSWTFCNAPVCWGLDTGWNHTFGECWLRHIRTSEDGSPAAPTFGQRGVYSAEYRAKMLHTRKACTEDKPGGLSDGWSCPPTHVPWTSGSLGIKADLSARWQTSGGWGNMRIHRLAADGSPVDGSCTRNGGQPCDPNVLGHAG